MAGGLPPGVSDRPFDARFLDGPVWQLDDPVHAGEAVAAARVFGVALIGARFAPQVDLAGFGFRKVETLLIFGGPIEASDRDGPPEGVRLARGTDADLCGQIAARAFQDDRWHADPEIPNDSADAFKRAWVANDVSGRVDVAIVAEGADGRIEGFNLVMVRNGMATIDLIAVDPSARRRGVAHRLIAAMGFFCDGCRTGTAGTQERNLASQRMYERAGWRILDRKVTWHWTPRS